MTDSRRGSRLSRLALWIFLPGIILVIFSFMTNFFGGLLYPAPQIPVQSPPPGLEEVALSFAKGEKISCWVYQHEVRSGPVLIYFHGNGENLETLKLSGLIDSLRELQASFVAVDYPGYGRSTGRASEEAIASAAQAALDYASQRFPDSRKVSTGWSLGASVAIVLAAEKKVDGLIAMSAWESLHATARIHYPGWLVSMILNEEYNSFAAAEKIRCPALIIHGEKDSLIPAEQGKKIADRLGPDARWVLLKDAAHNDLLDHPSVWDEISAFLKKLT